MVTKVTKYSFAVMRFIVAEMISMIFGHLYAVCQKENVHINDIEGSPVVGFDMPFTYPGVWVDDSLLQSPTALNNVQEEWNAVSIPLNRYIEYLFKRAWDEYEYAEEEGDRLYSVATSITFEPIKDGVGSYLAGKVSVSVFPYSMEEEGYELPYRSGKMAMPSAIRNFLNSFTGSQAPVDYSKLENALIQEQEAER